MRRMGRMLGRGGDAPGPVLSFGSWEDYPAGARVAAVCHPQWRGVRIAAYACDVPIVETADAAPIAGDLVAAMKAAGVGVVVVHGFPPGTEALLREASTQGVATRCVLHSSMTQHGAEPGEAGVAEAVLALAAAGVIDRVGFVKEGLAEAFAALGHPAAYVPNRVPRLPRFEPLDLGSDRLNVGVFAEPFWRKNVVTQLGAVALLDGARAHVMRRPEVGYLSGLDIVEHGTTSWDEFVQLEGSVDLNLYVTLSECQPMTPLESYAAGVPCLTSRTSVLFAGDPDLWDLTTIAEVDNPRAIAEAARRLLERREEAVAAARTWMAEWDIKAKKHWDEFVS